MLDLFAGQLSYKEIYEELTIDRLNDLTRARLRFIEKREELQKKMMEEAANNQMNQRR